MAPPSYPPPPAPSPVRLPLAHTEPDAPVVCSSNRYLWDEEIDLVRQMHEIKLLVRQARERGEQEAIDRLRVRFKDLDSRREKIRRERLDSQGLFDYD